MASDDAHRKLEQLRRIERVRTRLHEISAWRLASAQSNREKLAADRFGMIEALGAGILAYGPLSLAGTRRLRSIERELAAAGLFENDMRRRTFDDGRLAKLAIGFLEQARDALREDTERRSLEDLIDAAVVANSASGKPKG